MYFRYNLKFISFFKFASFCSDFSIEFKQRRCGNCGDLGHYKKGCKNPPKSPPTKTKSKGERPKMGSSSTQQSTTNDVPSSSGQQQTQNAASTSCVMDQNSQI